MTWQLASFSLLFLALAAGFAWYERARPPAKVIALVATLAALAALGRAAFAPLPNVKPTTDIVLIAGYVLGGAPGFAVGSIAALAAIVFGLLLAFAFETPPGQAVSLTGFVFLFYIPLGYYTDQFIYRRRVKQEASKTSKAR